MTNLNVASAYPLDRNVVWHYNDNIPSNISLVNFFYMGSEFFLDLFGVWLYIVSKWRYEMSEWHDATRELPTTSKHVLTFNQLREYDFPWSFFEIASYDDGWRRITCDGFVSQLRIHDIHDNVEVLAWMELPDHPNF